MELELRTALGHKSDDELTEIWVTNDRQKWRREAFETISAILRERGVPLPVQNEPAVHEPPAQSIAWLRFYTLGLLPIRALLALAGALRSPWAVFVAVPWAALWAGVAVGLHRRRAWAWRVNLFLLGVDTLGVLIGALRSADPVRFFVIAALWQVRG